MLKIENRKYKLTKLSYFIFYLSLERSQSVILSCKKREEFLREIHSLCKWVDSGLNLDSGIAIIYTSVVSP